MDLLGKLQQKSPAADFSDVKVALAYKLASASFSELVGRSYLQRPGELACDTSLHALTIKPYQAVSRWLTPSVRSKSPAATGAENARRCAEYFNDPNNREPNAKITLYDQLVWFTPFTHEFQGKLALMKSKLAEDVMSLPTATRLRNALGIVRTKPGTHIFGVVMGLTIEQMCAASACAAAPTVFDACDYERYRHWPILTHRPDENMGRSYELDPDERAFSAAYGFQEFVTGSMGIDQIQEIVYLGKVGKTKADEANMADAMHYAYVDDVVCEMPLHALVNNLATALNL